MESTREAIELQVKNTVASQARLATSFTLLSDNIL